MTCQLYRQFDSSGRLLYVGISMTVFSRIAQHKHHSKWFLSVFSITIEHFKSKPAALRAEALAIQNEKPIFNIKEPKRVKSIDPLKIDLIRGTNAEHNAKLKSAARPRALRIIRLREKGKTWKCIGAMFGISGSAAQALAARHRENKK